MAFNELTSLGFGCRFGCCTFSLCLRVVYRLLGFLVDRVEGVLLVAHPPQSVPAENVKDETAAGKGLYLASIWLSGQLSTN